MKISQDPTLLTLILAVIMEHQDETLHKKGTKKTAFTLWQ